MCTLATVQGAWLGAPWAARGPFNPGPLRVSWATGLCRCARQPSSVASQVAWPGLKAVVGVGSGKDWGPR